MYKIEDYPNIKNNYFLNRKDAGTCKRLVGKITILTVFMHNNKSKWTETSKNKYYDSLRKATNWLEKQSKKYNVNLKFERFHFDINVNDNINPHDDFNLIKDFLRVSNMQQAFDYYTKSLKCDECPFIIVYNHSGRSFGRAQINNSRYIVNECSSIFLENNSFSWKTIVHELLHQYGAMDYYFPKKVEEIANKYIGKSIMDTYLSECIDDFTAYMIGWKQTISGNTYWFLKETLWFNEKIYNEELDKQWRK